MPLPIKNVRNTFLLSFEDFRKCLGALVAVEARRAVWSQLFKQSLHLFDKPRSSRGATNLWFRKIKLAYPARNFERNIVQTLLLNSHPPRLRCQHFHQKWTTANLPRFQHQPRTVTKWLLLKNSTTTTRRDDVVLFYYY